jgi:ribosome-binding factor A
MNYRPLRVGQVIRDELGKLFLREVEFPEGAIATITEVDVDDKMDEAAVKISVLPSEKGPEALGILNVRTGKSGQD